MTRLDRMCRPDRPRLVELLRASVAFSADEVDVALDMFDEWCDAGDGLAGVDDALCDYDFVGAYDEAGRLTGYACAGPTPSTEGTFDMYWLAVDPAAQGGGIGRCLLHRVETLVAEQGGRLVLVETSSRPDYAPAREFYARNGYVEAARVRDFYAPADDRIMLTTRLTGRATR